MLTRNHRPSFDPDNFALSWRITSTFGKITLYSLVTILFLEAFFLLLFCHQLLNEAEILCQLAFELLCLALQEGDICGLLRYQAFIGPLQVGGQVQDLGLHWVAVILGTVLEGQLASILAHFRFVGLVWQEAPKSLNVHLGFFNFCYVVYFLNDLGKNLLLNLIENVVFYILLFICVDSGIVAFWTFVVLQQCR